VPFHSSAMVAYATLPEAALHRPIECTHEAHEGSMKASVDLTAASGGLSWVPTSPAEPGSQIDAGSVTLHPAFMSLHGFMV